MTMHQPPGPGYQYGPQSAPYAYDPRAYARPQPPRKTPLSNVAIAAIVVGVVMLGGCFMVMVGSAGKTKAPAAAVTADPSAQRALLAAQQKAAEEAKAAKEKTAVETFPQKSTEIAATLKKATTAADAGKWMQADADLTNVETSLASFRGTSVADSKPFHDLDTKAAAFRARVAPQVAKLAHAAAAAAAEKELKASSVSVTAAELFNAYQANEVAADDKYKGKKLLVTGAVASIDKGAFGGLHLRLATWNEFMPVMCSMESSEKASLAQLSRGEQVRVLCTGHGMILGSPSLGDCTLR